MAETCRRFTACFYTIVSNYNAVVGIHMVINSFICVCLLQATNRRGWRESVVKRRFVINYVPSKCHVRNTGFSYRYWVRFTELYHQNLTRTTVEAF